MPMMEIDEIEELDDLSYLIDLDLFQESNRSFCIVAWSCLCLACQERLATEWVLLHRI